MADVWNGCKRIFYITLFGVLLIITAYLFYSSLDTLTYANVLGQYLVGKRTNLFLLGISVLLLSLILIFLKSIHTWAETYKRQISLILFAVMITIQILLILNVRTSFRGDLLKVFDTAVSLAEGSGILANTHFSDYFMKYPNNIPLCLFTYGWLLFAKLIGIPYIYWMDFMKFINILFMNLGLLCSFSLICRYRSSWTGLCLLFLTFINPLWYLLGLMYYTSTISLAFSMGGIWLFEQARRNKSRWKKYFQYFAAGTVLMAGYKIRATVILTAVSILIYCTLHIKKQKFLYMIMPAFAVFLGAFILLGCYEKLERHYAGFKPEETGYPAVHWIMMSMQGAGGWNGIDDAYTGSFASKEERIAADMARIKERISDLNWGGIFILLKNKLRIVFADGTDGYQSLFQSMQEPSPLWKYIGGGRGDYLAVYLHSYHSMLMGLALLAIIRSAIGNDRHFQDIVIINICGAYLFYLLWESAQEYSIPFMCLFLMLGAEGLCFLEEKSCHLFPVQVKLQTAAVISGAAAILMLGILVLFVERSGQPIRIYVVLQDEETGNKISLQEDFTQTFQAGERFNHLQLWTANWYGAENDSVYDVKIRDESGQIAASGTINGSDTPCQKPYTLSFDCVEPQRMQTYTIEVSLMNPDCEKKVDFLYYQSSWDMYSGGSVYLDEEVSRVDLAFSVYQEN